MSVRLFLGNLPYSVREADLRAHLAVVGEPSQVVIPVDRETGRVRGFAFVDFDDRALAEAVIRQFDGQPFQGRPLAVNEARPRDQSASPSRPVTGGPPPAAAETPRVRGRGTGTAFGPNKPPRRPGGGARHHQADRTPKGPMRERSGGRMFTVDDDPRHADDGDLDNLSHDAELEPNGDE